MAGVATGVAVVGGALSKLGESVADCRGVETEASGSGQGALEADSCLLSSRLCTVKSCVCVCVWRDNITNLKFIGFVHDSAGR